MKIEASEVTRITIRGVEHLDPVSVFLEDFGPGQGRAVVECFGRSWAYFWPAMGNRKIIDFVIECGLDYMIKKFAPHIDREIPVDSEQEMRKEMKAEIVRRRLDDALSKKEARRIWEEVDDAYETINNNDLMYNVFGDDWWEYQPTQPNHEYQYMERIMKAVKDGLKMYKEQMSEVAV